MRLIYLSAVLGLSLALSLKWGKAEEKPVHFTNGSFWSETEKIDLAKDENFENLTNQFSNQDTIYLKIESDRFILLKGRNYLYIEDKDGNKLDQNGQFNREDVGVFKAEVKLDELDPGLYFVSVSIEGYGERRKPEKLLFKQSITIDDQNQHDQNQHLDWYPADKEEEVSLGVGQNRQMGFKLSLGNGEAIYSNFKVYDFEGNRQEVNNYQIREEQGTYFVDLNLLGLELSDDQWYWLNYDITSETNKRYRGAKNFYVKDRLPEAVIEMPEDKSEVSGQVEVRGTAKDELFYQYYLEVIGKDGDGLIGEIETDQVESDLLGVWESDNFDKGNYSLRLTVVDWVGNQKQAEVGVKFKDHTEKFRLKVPTKIEMDEVEVLTFDQVSHGEIGEADGKNGIEVEDDRGAYTGWSVTGSMSDFTADDQAIELPNLLVQPQQPVVINGQTEGLAAGGSIRPEANEIFSFMTADAGYGNGEYRQQALLNLDIEANVVAGDYQSQLIITLQ